MKSGKHYIGLVQCGFVARRSWEKENRGTSQHKRRNKDTDRKGKATGAPMRDKASQRQLLPKAEMSPEKRKKAGRLGLGKQTGTKNGQCSNNKIP